MSPIATDEATQAGNGIVPQLGQQQRPLRLPNTGDLIGRVASPVQQESTSEQCDFWVRRDCIAEKSQLVRVESQLAGRDVTFYGLIEEVHRRSRLNNIYEAFDGTDSDAAAEAPLNQRVLPTLRSASSKPNPTC
jgi:hypothetical protein